MEQTKKKEIIELKYQILKKKKEVMPSVWLFIGLLWGLLFNLLANIVHDMFKTFNYIGYEIVIFASSIIALILFIWYVGKYYVEPIEKAEQEIKELEKSK